MKKGVLKNFVKFTGKHLCQSPFFNNKVEDLRPATLLKKRLWQRCFPVNFRKFLRTPFLQNTYGRLLPSIINYILLLGQIVFLLNVLLLSNKNTVIINLVISCMFYKLKLLTMRHLLFLHYFSTLDQTNMQGLLNQKVTYVQI